ncbi:MAG TPA: AbrB/MazE/SpoVT family DNA-binding domain-containing protein [Bryobacteraceae bacterium]|jgi:AbrB family looped-hinge helix DNA binding protein
MSVVKVSPKYQIVIPREVRTRLRIKPGQRLSVIAGERGITLLPERSIKEMEGFLRGLPGDFEREPDREI